MSVADEPFADQLGVDGASLAGLSGTAAPGRENHRPRPIDDLRQTGLLEAPVTFLPIDREDFGDRKPAVALDLPVEFNERPPENPGRGGAKVFARLAFRPREQQDPA